MKILALDTAATACSVALLTETGLQEDGMQAERVQAETLLPMVEKLLTGAHLRLGDLDALAFGRGPGAFTGLRVAASVAQGLAYGAGLPVVPVSNLDALAATAVARHRAARIVACLDARMQEVYWAAYSDEGGDLQRLTEETLCPPGDLTLPPGDVWFGAGSAWAAYPEALKARVPGLRGTDATLTAGAGDIARLAYKAFKEGGAVIPERAVPVYLRDKVATPKF